MFVPCYWNLRELSWRSVGVRLTTTLSDFPCSLVTTVTISAWRSTTAPCITRLQFCSLPSVECWSKYLKQCHALLNFVWLDKYILPYSYKYQYNDIVRFSVVLSLRSYSQHFGDKNLEIGLWRYKFSTSFGFC